MSDQPERKKGRPKGSPNRTTSEPSKAAPEATEPATSCGNCGSTRRQPYFERKDVPHGGVCQLTGKTYTAVSFQQTRCSDCGQVRIDRQLIFAP